MEIFSDYIPSGSSVILVKLVSDFDTRCDACVVCSILLFTFVSSLTGDTNGPSLASTTSEATTSSATSMDDAETKFSIEFCLSLDSSTFALVCTAETVSISAEFVSFFAGREDYKTNNKLRGNLEQTHIQVGNGRKGICSLLNISKTSIVLKKLVSGEAGSQPEGHF